MKLVPMKEKKRRTSNADRSSCDISVELRPSSMHDGADDAMSHHASRRADAMHAPSHESHEMQMEMSMHSTIDLADPMSREGSGTSWIPDSSPMYGRMFMFGDEHADVARRDFPALHKREHATRR